MITAQDLRGVNAMVPAFATPDADSLDATSTIDVDNLAEGVDRIIKDGVPIITTTGSFGECYNLFWDEFKLLASTTVEVVNKRVPVFIGATSPNPREAVQRMKFIQDIGADGTLLGLPYYDTVSAEYVGEFYTQMAQHFPELAIMIYHNPTNHKTTIPVSAFRRIVQNPNIVAMKDSHRSTLVFADIQRITGGKISFFVNQTQLYPYVQLGAAGCWSSNVFMGPWPVLYLWDLVEQGLHEEALAVSFEIRGPRGATKKTGSAERGDTMQHAKTTGRPDLADRGGTMLHKFAGYVDPGPTRTPVLQPSEDVVEDLKARAAYWTTLCEKYRPLVEARRAAGARV